MFLWMKSALRFGWNHLRKQFALPEARDTHPGLTSWNAGLVIDPTEFSRQLANLHMSMRQANAPASHSDVVVHSSVRRD